MSDEFNTVAELFIFMAVVLVVFLTILSSGEVDYCYMETGHADTVTLMGHRNWRFDSRVSSFSNLDSAIEGAKKMNCPLLKK